jgi:hypothetical protein
MYRSTPWLGPIHPTLSIAMSEPSIPGIRSVLELYQISGFRTIYIPCRSQVSFRAIYSRNHVSARNIYTRNKVSFRTIYTRNQSVPEPSIPRNSQCHVTFKADCVRKINKYSFFLSFFYQESVSARTIYQETVSARTIYTRYLACYQENVCNVNLIVERLLWPIIQVCTKEHAHPMLCQAWLFPTTSFNSCKAATYIICGLFK